MPADCYRPVYTQVGFLDDIFRVMLIARQVEGRITFHTAMSTAYPQPAPGTAPSPGPLQVPADQLHRVLGIRDVHYVQGQHSLALVEAPLG